MGRGRGARRHRGVRGAGAAGVGPEHRTAVTGGAHRDRLTAAREEYLRCLGEGDEAGAVRHVLDLLRDPTSAVDVLVEVIAAAQRIVGELWQANEWNVAQEHIAT